MPVVTSFPVTVTLNNMHPIFHSKGIKKVRYDILIPCLCSLHELCQSLRLSSAGPDSPAGLLGVAAGLMEFLSASNKNCSILLCTVKQSMAFCILVTTANEIQHHYSVRLIWIKAVTVVNFTTLDTACKGHDLYIF